MKHLFSLFETLLCLSPSALISLARSKGHTGEGPHRDLALFVSGFTEQTLELTKRNLHSSAVAKLACGDCKELLGDNLCGRCLKQKEEIEDGSEVWTEEVLTKKKNPELKTILTQLGAKPKGNKCDMVADILFLGDADKLASIEPRVESFLGKPRDGKNPLHAFYGSKFGVVDKCNQQGMGRAVRGRMKSQKGRMIRGLMRFPLVNVKCIVDYFECEGGGGQNKQTKFRTIHQACAWSLVKCGIPSFPFSQS